MRARRGGLVALAGLQATARRLGSAKRVCTAGLLFASDKREFERRQPSTPTRGLTSLARQARDASITVHSLMRRASQSIVERSSKPDFRKNLGYDPIETGGVQATKRGEKLRRSLPQIAACRQDFDALECTRIVDRTKGEQAAAPSLDTGN